MPTYRIVARSALDLVKFTQVPEFVNTAVASADKAGEIDVAHRGDWGLLKARTFDAAGERERAIAQYRTVIGSDPQNRDALYELALLLVKSQSAADLKEAAGYLERFVTLAPADDDRLPAAKKAVQALGSS